MVSIDWSGLRQELAIWRAENLLVPIWWRDDDAIEPTRQLDRLSAAAETLEIPVHLAVIPAQAKQVLADFVVQNEQFRPVAHGWSHANHSRNGAKSSEFGTPRENAADDALRALGRISALFGKQAHPMFVPPWNRIDPGLFAALAEMGYCALSTYGPRKTRFAAPGMVQINTHIDPVDWRGTRGCLPPDVILDRLVTHLWDRRTGKADNAEPLGLLTHHLMQDEATWAFSHALMKELREAPHSIFDIAQAKELP